MPSIKIQLLADDMTVREESTILVSERSSRACFSEIIGATDSFLAYENYLERVRSEGERSNNRTTGEVGTSS